MIYIVAVLNHCRYVTSIDNTFKITCNILKMRSYWRKYFPSSTTINRQIELSQAQIGWNKPN